MVKTNLKSEVRHINPDSIFHNPENPAILQEDKLIRCSNLLENASLKLMSFDKISNYAEHGDFVYLDPPYYPAINGRNFTSYQKDKFLEEEHEKLLILYGWKKDRKQSKISEVCKNR